MPSYIDTKYVNLVSTRLPLFKQKTTNLYNFRCPFCGDSQKKKTIIVDISIKREQTSSFIVIIVDRVIRSQTFSNKWMVSCTNNMSLRDTKRDLTGKSTTTPDPEFKHKKPVFYQSIELPKISELDDTHYAKRYIVNRGIPPSYLNRLYFTDDFKGFTYKLTQRHYDLNEKEARIIIPFFNETRI